MTTTVNKTLGLTLDEANPQKIADALRKVKLGTLLAPTKKTFLQTASPTVVITPPALHIMDANVRDGSATLGARHVADDASTPGAPGANGPGIATLSDDGTTLTFEDDVTEVIVTYIPRSSTDLTSDFPETGVG